MSATPSPRFGMEDGTKISPLIARANISKNKRQILLKELPCCLPSMLADKTRLSCLVVTAETLPVDRDVPIVWNQL
jgi:retron-type reverse transcriptase